MARQLLSRPLACAQPRRACHRDDSVSQGLRFLSKYRRYRTDLILRILCWEWLNVARYTEPRTMPMVYFFCWLREWVVPSTVFTLEKSHVFR